MKRLYSLLLLLLAFSASATTLNPIQLLNPVGSTSGQAILSTGTSTVPVWGNIAATSLSAQAANTVVGNFTGSSASPTAFVMPSCTGATNALGYTSGTGIVCNGSINAATLGGATFASPGAIGSTTASTGRFTSVTATTGGASITGGLTVASGGASITGGLTMTTGAITPVSTSGIVGTTTNDNAVAGAVGEYTSASNTGTSLTTATAANCTSVSLTAGDWDVTGAVTTVPAGGTTVTQRAAGISTTSATLPASNAGGFVQLNYSSAAGAAEAIQAPVVRISLASTTTVFLVTQVAFSGSTATCNGFIRARRVR